MSSIAFQIPLKSPSINHSHDIYFQKGKPIRGKTPETVYFERQFHFSLMNHRKILSEFAKSYCKFTHSVEVEATYYIDEKLFFTKPKSQSNPRIELNRNAGDLDNLLKIPIDLIFGYLGINDKTVKRYGNIRQVPSDMNGMAFTLRLLPFPQFESFKDIIGKN